MSYFAYIIWQRRLLGGPWSSPRAQPQDLRSNCYRSTRQDGRGHDARIRVNMPHVKAFVTFVYYSLAMNSVDATSNHNHNANKLPTTGTPGSLRHSKTTHAPTENTCKEKEKRNPSEATGREKHTCMNMPDVNAFLMFV